MGYLKSYCFYNCYERDKNSDFIFGGRFSRAKQFSMSLENGLTCGWLLSIIFNSNFKHYAQLLREILSALRTEFKDLKVLPS